MSLFPHEVDGEPGSERVFNWQGKQSKNQVGLGSPVCHTGDFSLQSPRAMKSGRNAGARIQRFSSLRGPQVLIGAEEKACKICGLMEGTDCLICSSCNAGYHPYCLEPTLGSLPKSAWHCPACVLKQHDKGNPVLPPACGARVISHGGTQDVILVGEEKEEHADQSIGKINDECLKVANDECLCKVCEKDDDQVLLCDSCESAYHMHCLTPALDRVPEEEWYCPVCVSSGNGPFHSHLLHEVQHTMHGCLLKEPLHHCAVCDRIDGNGLNFLENGVLEDLISADLGKCCKICGVKDGKSFISCDACAKAYHLYCLEPPLRKAPLSTWYCPSCLCQICKNDTDDHMILLCDACDEGFHTYCLSPPLERIPKGSWCCPTCSAVQKAAAEARSPKEIGDNLICDNPTRSSEDKEQPKRKRNSKN